MRTRHRNRWLLSVLVSLCLTLCACSSGSNAPAPDPKPSGTEDTGSSGSRDATPQVLTPAIRNLIREGKVHQIDGIIYTSAALYLLHEQSNVVFKFIRVSPKFEAAGYTLRCAHLCKGRPS